MAQTQTTPLSGATILVQCLLNHGVEVVFAYPGGASMPIHQALTQFKSRLRTILPRHEQGGGFAAEGYARSTGKVGVCLATSGPGATNFVTCLADAKMDSVPLLAVTGQVGTPVIGTDAFQETPIIEICRAITKHHYLVTRLEDLPRVFKEAFYIATTGRPGPVIIDVPKDVQNQLMAPDYDPPMNLPGYRPFRQASEEQLKGILALLRQSKRPIVYAGGGIIASGAAPHLRAFAEKTGVPVALTVHGSGRFDGTRISPARIKKGTTAVPLRSEIAVTACGGSILTATLYPGPIDPSLPSAARRNRTGTNMGSRHQYRFMMHCPVKGSVHSQNGFEYPFGPQPAPESWQSVVPLNVTAVLPSRV